MCMSRTAWSVSDVVRALATAKAQLWAILENRGMEIRLIVCRMLEPAFQLAAGFIPD